MRKAPPAPVVACATTVESAARRSTTSTPSSGATGLPPTNVPRTDAACVTLALSASRQATRARVRGHGPTGRGLERAQRVIHDESRNWLGASRRPRDAPGPRRDRGLVNPVLEAPTGRGLSPTAPLEPRGHALHVESNSA